jgi:hypothetical protein
MGPVGIHGFVVSDVGRIYVADHGDIGVGGLLADAEVRWRFAAGDGSLARAEALYASGDADGDATYTGMLTANSWGVVGALYATHGCYLLFPDPGSIDREVAVVADVSDQGAGLVALTAGVGYDLVPNRLGLNVGGGHARTAAGEALGTEFNARISAHPFPLGTLSLIGAGVYGSRFGAPPWTALLTFDWLTFG